jgi:hypothetical protein
MLMKTTHIKKAKKKKNIFHNTSKQKIGDSLLMQLHSIRVVVALLMVSILKNVIACRKP